jgi:signal peptidase I
LEYVELIVKPLHSIVVKLRDGFFIWKNMFLNYVWGVKRVDKLINKRLEKRRRQRKVSNISAMKKILNSFGNGIIVLLIVLVGFSIYGNIQTRGKAYRVPSIGSYMWMSVLSNSMKPVFSAGDLIIDKKVEVKDLKTGDIVTFVWGTSLSTHRIAEVISDNKGNISFKTKGDNNNVIDLDVVDSNKIVGKYAFKVPFVGYIFTKLKGLAGVILIWIMFISVVGTEIYRNIKTSKAKRIKEIITQ